MSKKKMKGEAGLKQKTMPFKSGRRIQNGKRTWHDSKESYKNYSSPSQQWKEPVKVWVRELYEKKFGKVLDQK